MRRPTCQEETFEQQTARHVAGMHDSVNLINQLIAAQVTDQDSLDIIFRNKQHLEIMLVKPIVPKSGLDLSAISLCIRDAANYLTIHPLED